MEEKNNYLKGFIGGLIGAIIFGIPWVVIYVYGGYILSILALLIGYGTYKFYKLFGGKTTKKTGLIITIISIIVVSILTLIVIPNLLLIKDNYKASFDNVKLLYQNKDFIFSLLKDYVISLVFTMLGISGIIAKINKEAYLKTTDEEKYKYLDFKTNEEQIKELEKIYKKYNATSKENAVPKSLILGDILALNKNKIFNDMIDKGILIYSLNKTYMDLDATKDDNRALMNSKKNKNKKVLATVIITLIIVVCSVILGLFMVDEQKEQTIKFYDLNMELPTTFIYSEEDSSEKFKAYYNNNDSINLIGLLTDTKVDDYKNLYIDMLNENYSVLKDEDFNNGFKVYYKSEADYYYLDYIYYINDDIYAVIFGSSESDLDKLTTNTQKYIDTISFNNTESV